MNQLLKHFPKQYLKQYLIFSLLLVMAWVGGCTQKSEKPNKTVGLILDRGGKDDKSFNSAAFHGAAKATQELGLTLKDIECPDDAAFEPAMRAFAQRGYPLIIAIGFAQRDAVQKVASEFPNIHFALVDAVVEKPNVLSLMFQEHEGSYLVGYLAGLFTKTNVVGFVGGMDTPLIKRFQMGFEAGVKSANPKAVIKVNFVGVTSEAWANPSRGKELALTQFSQKVDVVFAPAGASNMGVFDAAEERKLFAIGVDSNQNYVKPGRILTSMLKRVDVAVHDAIHKEFGTNFESGVKYFGLKDGGIDIAIDAHNDKLVQPYKEKIAKIKENIVAGAITVPDYYLFQKSKTQ